MDKPQFTLVGGGLVGSLLAIYLERAGFDVKVYEKRGDPRSTMVYEGRSINLALSHRGIRALEEIGCDKKILQASVPMYGRMIHDVNGNTQFQPYGEENQCIYSISRSALNRLLTEQAESNGVEFYFNKYCKALDVKEKKIWLENTADNSIQTLSYNWLIGADGAFSRVREFLSTNEGFTSHIQKLGHGYKELHIPPVNGDYGMEKNALHIWPREQFMLIALPNTDASFTATLFLPLRGEYSFEQIKTEDDIKFFFQTHFPDALSLIPELEKKYFSAEASFLVTVHAFPWAYKDEVLLVGDAAHAIVPFYGQGMNAGFEGMRILNSLIRQTLHNPGDTFKLYETLRKKDTDAIAELALNNFIEMRDLVADENFLLRKKIEALIHQKIPSYLPLYSMVTFSDIPYSEALEKGKIHDQMMGEIMQIKDIQKIWDTDHGWHEIQKILRLYQII